MLITPEYVHKPLNNSYVLICWKDRWNSGCLTGFIIYQENNVRNNQYVKRFIEVRNGERVNLYLIGNNQRVFNVVYIVPREIWITIHVLITGYLIYKLSFMLKIRIKRAFGEVGVILNTMLLILILNGTIIGSAYVDQSIDIKYIPGVHIEKTFYIENSTLIIRVNTTGVYKLLNATCYILDVMEITGNITYLKTIIENNTVKTIIPFEIYETIYSKLSIKYWFTITLRNTSLISYIKTTCRLFFDKGELELNIPIRVVWRELDISLTDNILVIKNSNPVNFTVRLSIIDKHRSQLIYTREILIEKFSINKIEIELRRDCRILIQYVFANISRSVVLDAI